MTVQQTVLMVEHGEDAEAVRVEVDGGVVRLVLEDGERLVFDAAELRSAVAPAGLREAA